MEEFECEEGFAGLLQDMLQMEQEDWSCIVATPAEDQQQASPTKLQAASKLRNLYQVQAKQRLLSPQVYQPPAQAVHRAQASCSRCRSSFGLLICTPNTGTD